MRLDFNVLWVENLQKNVQAQKERIEFLLRKDGFRLQVEFASSVDEAKKYLGDEIFGDHIDLILMDYDLGAGAKGDEGLAVVRDIFSYKDIIFYSAQANDLKAKVAAKQLQGIYCSDRNDLPDTVEGVFQALVKKVLDIDHSRGIIMGATSDIDNLVNDCLRISCVDGGGKLSASTMKIIADRVKEIRKRFEKDLAKVESVMDFEGLLKLHFLYTSVDRLNLLRESIHGSGKHDVVCADIKKYSFETIPKRNILAHVRVQRSGFSRKLVDGDGKELTSEQMKELRQALLEHQENFEKLAASLNAV